MKQFTLRLDRKQQRPVVLLKNVLTALVDTGAFIPIWTDDEEILVNVLDAGLVKEKVPSTICILGNIKSPTSIVT